MELQDYIEQADDAVRDSIRNLTDIDIEIDSCNDEGCNGYVVFGKHTVFRTRVAVKYYCYGENAHEEVTLIKQITNPNVLRVWDAHAIADGWAYFITDEHRNGNIDDLLQTNKIDTHTAIRIIRGMLSGVSALHASPNNLLHRDLKPANILVDYNFSPIIADFGSIKRMPENASEVVASKHSALYRPPESYDGGKYYYTSDIYQIGMLFYQLLGGYLPYEAKSYLAKEQIKRLQKLDDDFEKSKYIDSCLVDKARREKLLDLSSLPSYTDKRLTKIIKIATKANPENRYSNISEMRLALHSIGNLPNWYREEEILFCKNLDDFYRISKTQKGKYSIERKYSNLKWSRLRGSSLYNTECGAIEYLISTF